MLEHIHNSNLIEDINSPAEDAQSLKAWEFLSEQRKITDRVVCEVQRLITLNQTELDIIYKGKYRSLSKCNVWVGARKCPEWSMVEPLMHNFVLDMRDWRHTDPKSMHVRFEQIHPFRDGNGRTGRMLMWWHQRSLGLEPTLVNFSDRAAYYRWFKTKEELQQDQDRLTEQLFNHLERFREL